MSGAALLNTWAIPFTEWEPVYTVNDYYRIPRLGVAELGGEPHIYESTFDEAVADYTEHFLVCPIEPELLDLVMQQWRIWQRWTDAYAAGRVSLDSHPALPEDVEVNQTLHCLIGDRLTAKAKPARKLWARFRPCPGASGGVQVRWFERVEESRSCRE